MPASGSMSSSSAAATCCVPTTCVAGAGIVRRSKITSRLVDCCRESRRGIPEAGDRQSTRPVRVERVLEEAVDASFAKRLPRPLRWGSWRRVNGANGVIRAACMQTALSGNVRTARSTSSLSLKKLLILVMRTCGGCGLHARRGRKWIPLAAEIANISGGKIAAVHLLQTKF